MCKKFMFFMNRGAKMDKFTNKNTESEIKNNENALQETIDNFKEKEKQKHEKKYEIQNFINKLIDKTPNIYIPLLSVTICFICGTLGGILAVKMFPSDFQNNQSNSQPANNEINEEIENNSSAQNSSQFSVTLIAERNIKSIVEITSEMPSSNKYSSNKALNQYSSSGSGSGIIVSGDGYIITNNHVISGANKINVTVEGKNFDAQFIGSDSEFDIALIKIDAAGLQPVTFGDSANIRLAESVVAIGGPFEKASGSVAKGIISSLERTLTINNETLTLLQIDAPVNSASSGGGLFNLRGELIGMIISKSKSVSDTIGFAIPVNNLKKPLNDLKEFGYIRGKADIGMQTSDVSGTKSNTGGAVITEIFENSNAQAAGFQVGDCIISIDSKDVTNTSSLGKIIKGYVAGDIVSVGIIRKEEKLNLNLQFSEKNSS